MKPHLEVLDKKRGKYFKELKAFKNLGYLAGGTALALQLAHRISYDFDIFCDKPISKNLLLKVKKSFALKDVLINNADELTFLTRDNIKISFIHYPFNLKKYLIKNNYPIKLLNIKGIAINKAYVLNRRNSWRDYADLYFILRSKKVSLSKIIAEARKVYQQSFSEKLFLSQLLYTEDISKVEIKQAEFLKEKVGLKQVKDYFQEQINTYTKKLN